MSSTAGPTRREAYVRRMTDSTSGAFDVATAYLGLRLGLYRALAERGPATAAELAARTGTNERLVREWLEQQAATEILEATREGEAWRFALPADHATVLLDPDVLDGIGGTILNQAADLALLPRLVETFRTAFFLNAAFERSWLRLRWIVWGNLVFTGVLLIATYWHAGEFHWNPFQTPLAHIWIVLYIFEPVVMIYLIPRGTLSAPSLTSGGPVSLWLKRFLVLVTGLLLMNGLLIFINPEFAASRWAWELNPLDARMVSAWFLGWSAWCGTMAFAQDWDEIRTAARLFILNGVALLAVTVVFRDELLPGRGTATGFGVGLAVMTGIMIAFHVLQDRRRPIDQPAPAGLSDGER